jgi:hypothetical protein
LVLLVVPVALVAVCSRIPDGKYQVVFFADSFLVYRVGNTTPVFSARWKP